MTSTVFPGFNYATYFGIESSAAAIVFAILYAPLLLWFVLRSFRIPTYVHFTLSLFCSMRMAAFTMRAVLAASDGAGQNSNLLIAEQVVFNVGYFGLLYSAYTLVLDREIMSDLSTSDSNIFSRLTRNRRLFRLCMLSAIVLGIVGLTMSTSSDASQSSINTGTALRKASVIVFLALTVLQAIKTIKLATSEYRQKYRPMFDSWGTRHAVHILCIISILLMIREVFYTATIANIAQAGNEHLWYPLAATTEIIAVILYGVPGLVPSRSGLKQHSGHEMSNVYV